MTDRGNIYNFYNRLKHGLRPAETSTIFMIVEKRYRLKPKHKIKTNSNTDDGPRKHLQFL